MTRYRPAFRKQLDGSRCASDNCNCATHAMLADYSTQGAKKPTPSAIRNYITPSACGGTNNEANIRALAALAGITDMRARYNVPFADAITLIRSGRAGEFTIQYSAIHGTKYDSSPSFLGRHAVAVVDATDTAALVGDPLADGRMLSIGRPALAGYQWWPLSTLKAACSAAGTAGLVDACDFTRDIVPEPVPPSEIPMPLPITDPAPKKLAVKKGDPVLKLDGTPLTTFSDDYSGIDSPFGTTLGGKAYRAANVSVGGVKQLVLVPVAVASDPPPTTGHSDEELKTAKKAAAAAVSLAAADAAAQYS